MQHGTLINSGSTLSWWHVMVTDSKCLTDYDSYIGGSRVVNCRDEWTDI